MQETGYSYGAKLTAVKEVSKQVKLSETTVRNWVADYDTMLLVQKSQRGKHSKVGSPIMSDPEFKAEFKYFVKNNSRKNGNIQNLFHQLRYVFYFYSRRSKPDNRCLGRMGQHQTWADRGEPIWLW
jgi:hypothetical protein